MFGLLAIGCELLYYAVVVDSQALFTYLRGLAQVSGWILGILGYDVEVNHTLVSTPGFAVQIAHGCDAIQICALYSAAVIAFPVGWRRKLLGLVLGIAWLQLLNQVRIVSLVLIGRCCHAIFDDAHFKIWPTFLIIVTVISWMIWVRWATREAPGHAQAAA